MVDGPLPIDARIAVELGGVAGGGPAATAAIAIARQGIAVAFAGRVGTDEAGALVASGLAREGVDTSLLQVTSGALTAFSAVVVDRATASRLILSRSGPPPLGDPGPELTNAVTAAKWVHVDQDGWRALVTLLGRCAMPLLSVDGGNPIPGLDLSYVALYAPSESAILTASGLDDLDAAMHWALDSGAGLVVVTRGPDGSAAMGRFDLEAADAAAQLGPDRAVAGRYMRIDEPARRGDVVSTLGAGDVFHGLLVAAISERHSVREAMRFANVGAALSCRGLDGRSAIPDREALSAAVREVADAELLSQQEQGTR